MKILARKKKEQAPSGGNAPWMNTFADLMNLLLCFFVMLFAMSEVDREVSGNSHIYVHSFGIFDAGGRAFGEGPLISSGMSQLRIWISIRQVWENGLKARKKTMENMIQPLRRISGMIPTKKAV